MYPTKEEMLAMAGLLSAPNRAQFYASRMDQAAELLRAIADSVDDTKRMDWLDRQGYSYGFENEHHGNRWLIDGPFRSVRDAIDAAMNEPSGNSGELGDGELPSIPRGLGGV